MTYPSDGALPNVQPMNLLAHVMSKDHYLLRQTAEECCELAQACMKFIRADKLETPMTREQAWAKILEEYADVQLMLDLMETLLDDKSRNEIVKTYGDKWKRCDDRLIKGIKR